MDKTAIKNYAIYARNKLIQSTKDKAALYGITKDNISSPVSRGSNYEIYKTQAGTEITLDSVQMEQRRNLVSKIRQDGFDNTIEEIAYTWFNRLIAVRFMEVNDYLPSRLRVLSSEKAGKKESDLMSNPFDAGFFYTNEEGLQISAYVENNNANELFKLLFIKQCNELANTLPGLFEQTSDYTELLFSINYIDIEDIVYKLVNEIPESNFNVEQEGQVEIIGWLYQYYNTEPKAKVYARKSNEKVKKEELPAVTQLFTPDWIVRYMVENSVGRLWNDGHPNQKLKSRWKYYLEETEQKEEVKAQLQKIKEGKSKLKLEEIKIIDPCMGSGHILVYAFDVLMQIYRSEGWSDREAVESIIKNNLYGLDIDERAYQLAYFAVMMKAREYSRRVFSQAIRPNVWAIQESNNITEEQIKSFGSNYRELITKLVKQFNDAKEIGSLVNITLTQAELDALDSLINEMIKMSSYGSLLSQAETENKINIIYPLVSQAKLLHQKYDIVVTNPPYQTVSECSEILQKYILQEYPESKTDLYSAFIEKGLSLSKMYLSMITKTGWMFNSRFQKLREKLYRNNLINLVELGTHAFDEISGEIVNTVTFCYAVYKSIDSYKSVFIKLTDYPGEKNKEEQFSDRNNYYYKDVHSCLNIPDYPFAYYISDAGIDLFRKGQFLKDVLSPKQGTSTGDDTMFIRCWFEPDFGSIGFNMVSNEQALNSGFLYFPIDKGGEYRKWYGNNDRLIKYDKYHYKKLLDMGNHLPSRDYYFKQGLTWSKITSELSVRFSPIGYVFSSVGLKGFPNDTNMYYLLAFMNSIVCKYFIKAISPGMSIVSGDIERIPVKFDNISKVSELSRECVSISQSDWDSFETSWDFKSHPLVRLKPLPNDDRTVVNTCGDKGSLCSIDYAHTHWMFECEDRFNELKANEEELNRLFIDMYGLQKELTPEVDDKDITVRKANYQRDVKSLISYAVGCMFGRYSLDEEGLIYAGGDFNPNKYISFNVDVDNIIPIRDEEYFEDDDIVSRFVEFIRTVYGSKELEENLDSIARALKPETTMSSREVIRQYFLNEFFKDHCQTYQVTGSGKRPIYWLFDSGKQSGFKALIYMHRYDETTCARVRTDYLHKVQSFYENGIANDEYTIEHSSIRSDVTKATKHRDKLLKQLAETRLYDQALAHIANQRISIDLDDGVKINYAKFQDVEVINEGSKKVKVNLLASIK